MKRIFLVGLMCFAGCAFKVNGNVPIDDRLDLSLIGIPVLDLSVPGSGPDLSLADLETAPVDMLPGPDMAPNCVANSKVCVAGNTQLDTCRSDGSGFDTANCAYGCATTGAGAHCRVFTPSAPVITADFAYTDLTAISFTNAGNYVFDTATGTITGPTGVLRAANATPTTAAVVTTNGASIGFRRTAAVNGVPGAGVWAFASLSVGAGVNILFEDSVDAATATPNQYAAAFASTGAVSVAGTIDVRGYSDTTVATATVCGGTTVAGPGGGIGGTGGAANTANAAGGTGAGARGSTSPGGGQGASFGGAGSLGGNTVAGDNAAPAAYGTLALSPLVGGSGGGAGGSAGFPVNGGGGGGAFETVSKVSITVTGVINAGGCNGSLSARGVGAGGGGSGGAILLEAGTINLTSGVVSANGAGGGGGGQSPPPGTGNTPGSDGSPGQGLTAASGGTAGGLGGAGGNGGAAGSLAGKPGVSGAAAKAAVNGAGGGGGGGGAAGRIRLNTTAGTATGTSGTLSPATTDTTACSVGMLNLQ